MNELLLPYIAGYFDGEGCISIRRNGLSGTGRVPQYQVTVSISNTRLPNLEVLQKQFGGSIHKFPSRPKCQPAWQWHLGEGGAANFLEQIRPYLRDKADQAWLALEFLAQKTPGRRGVRLSDEEVALREGFYWAVKLAKGRVD